MRWAVTDSTVAVGVSAVNAGVGGPGQLEVGPGPKGTGLGHGELVDRVPVGVDGHLPMGHQHRPGPLVRAITVGVKEDDD